MKNLKVEALLYPWVFIAEADGNIKGRYHIDRDFNGDPHKGSPVKMSENGKWDVLGNTVNENCVGGTCPIK